MKLYRSTFIDHYWVCITTKTQLQVPIGLSIFLSSRVLLGCLYTCLIKLYLPLN